eukprot:4529665-Pyramimonas_sp.AAC.1
MEEWAEKREPPGVTRPFLEPVRAVLRQTAQRFCPRRRCAIESYLCAAFCAQDGRWRRGETDMRECQACGNEIGTQQH